MPGEVKWTKIQGKRIRLSNLEKVLYPNAQVTKAEVIQYYLEVAPYMLPHVRHRPMSFVRFPDGVDGTSFYQKDRPDYTPDWIKGFEMGQDTIKEYIVIEETPDIVWLATMACLEMHQMQVKTSRSDFPDHIVFDLDPSPGVSFTTIVEVCFKLKKFLEFQGFPTFIKTSGGKGFHLFIPIKANQPADLVKKKSKELAAEFVRENPAMATLHLPKKKRTDKILIDIYRNALYSTVVAPYSLRGKTDAPVSMPLRWDQVEGVEHAQSFGLANVLHILKDQGDAWHEMYEQSIDLLRTEAIAVQMEVPREKLAEYYEKRDFRRTPEPEARKTIERLNRFVIHRHLATRLHYDLRLEENGVLMCWAIPRGLPFREGEKRLAIRTEDHPISYLRFEGEIPKGEYGAGVMDVFERGTFEWVSKEESKLSFRLSGKYASGNYLMYQTNSEQWIVECRSDQIISELKLTDTHMLADQVTEIPQGGGWQYEVKWDGIRIFLLKDDERIQVYSRSGREITNLFPEVVEAAEKLDCNTGIIDGEIVVLDDVGRSVFKNVISRMHTKGTAKIKQLMKSKPVVLYAFDMIFLDGKRLTDQSLKMRQRWLGQVVKSPGVIRCSEPMNDGVALFHAAKQLGLEGIMAKRLQSQYHPGERSHDWLKIKFRNAAECLILGYTEGEGRRAKYFGSLHLAQLVDGELIYRGRVGTGFDDQGMREMMELLALQNVTGKPFDETIQEERKSTWVEPELSCEIQYASMTANGTFREPVFKKIIDKSIE